VFSNFVLKILIIKLKLIFYPVIFFNFEIIASLVLVVGQIINYFL
jgi:hypothetical protein